MKATLPAQLTTKDRQKNKSTLAKINKDLPEKALAEFEKYFNESHFGKELKPENVIRSLDPLVYPRERAALESEFKRIKTMLNAIETGAKNAAEHTKPAASYATALAKAARKFIIDLDRDFQAFLPQLDKAYKAKLKASPPYQYLQQNAAEIRKFYDQLVKDMKELDAQPTLAKIHALWGTNKSAGRGFITKIGTWLQVVQRPFPETAASVWNGNQDQFLRLPYMDDLADEQGFKLTNKVKALRDGGMREHVAVATMLNDLERSVAQAEKMCDYLEEVWRLVEKAGK